MLISEYSLLPTGAPQPRNHLWHHSLCPHLSCPDLIWWRRWGCVVSSGVESLHRGEESKCADGWAMGHADVGVTTHPLLHIWARGIGSLILGSLMLSESLYCCEMYSNWTADVQNRFLTVNTALGESLPRSSVQWVFCPLEAKCLRKWLMKNSLFLKV